MKALRNILTLMLAVVFLYSAVGHSILLHYCKVEVSSCGQKSSCCCESNNEGCMDPKPADENAIAVTTPFDQCCLTTSEYLVNPFSVREPHKFDSRIIVPAIAEIIHVPFVNYFSTQSNTAVVSDKPPAQRDILSFNSILII